MTGPKPSIIPAKPKPEPINNTDLIASWTAEGGRVFHVRASKRHRGVTFAYKVKGRRVEFATAVQHTSDTFTKKVGTKIAIEHFRAGKTVVLPLSPYQPSALHLFDTMMYL